MKRIEGGIAGGIQARGLTLELGNSSDTPPSSPVNIRPSSEDNHVGFGYDSRNARSLFHRIYTIIPVRGDGSCLLNSILHDTEAKSTLKSLRNQGSFPSQHSKLVDFFRTLVAEKMKEKPQRELSNCWSEETQNLDFSKASSDKALVFLIGILSDKCELDCSDKGEMQRVIDQYVNEIKIPERWLGQNEIIVISEEILRRPIYIYDHDGNNTHWEITSEDEVLPQEEMRVGVEFDKKPIRIRFIHNCHYESVLTNEECSIYLESERAKIAKQQEKNTKLYSETFDRVKRVAGDHFFQTRDRYDEGDRSIFSLEGSSQYQNHFYRQSQEANKISLAESAIELVKGTEWLERVSDALDKIKLIEHGPTKSKLLDSLSFRIMDDIPPKELEYGIEIALWISSQSYCDMDRTRCELAKRIIRNAPLSEWNTRIYQALKLVKSLEDKLIIDRSLKDLGTKVMEVLFHSLSEGALDFTIILEKAKIAWDAFDSVKKHTEQTKRTFEESLTKIINHKLSPNSAEILVFLESTPNSPVKDFVYSIVAKNLLKNEHPSEIDSKLSKILELVDKIKSPEIREWRIKSLVDELLQRTKSFHARTRSEDLLQSMMAIAEAFSDKKYYKECLIYLINSMTQSALFHYSVEQKKNKLDQRLACIKLFLDSQKSSTARDRAYLHFAAIGLISSKG